MRLWIPLIMLAAAGAGVWEVAAPEPTSSSQSSGNQLRLFAPPDVPQETTSAELLVAQEIPPLEKAWHRLIQVPKRLLPFQASKQIKLSDSPRKGSGPNRPAQLSGQPADRPKSSQTKPRRSSRRNASKPPAEVAKPNIRNEQTNPASVEDQVKLWAGPSSPAQELSPEQIRQVIRSLDQKIRHQPDRARWYALRGKAYAQLGQWDRALEDLNRAVALDPQLVEAYGNRGLVLRQQGRLREALRDFNTVVRLAPQEAKGYLDRGWVYYLLGKWRKALANAAQALRRDARLWEAHHLRALAFARLGQFRLALQEALAAARLAPWNLRLNHLALLGAAGAGKYDQALLHWEQLHGISREEPSAWVLNPWRGVTLSPAQLVALNRQLFDPLPGQGLSMSISQTVPASATVPSLGASSTGQGRGSGASPLRLRLEAREPGPAPSRTPGPPAISQSSAGATRASTGPRSPRSKVELVIHEPSDAVAGSQSPSVASSGPKAKTVHPAQTQESSPLPKPQPPSLPAMRLKLFVENQSVPASSGAKRAEVKVSSGSSQATADPSAFSQAVVAAPPQRRESPQSPRSSRRRPTRGKAVLERSHLAQDRPCPVQKVRLEKPSQIRIATTPSTSGAASGGGSTPGVPRLHAAAQAEEAAFAWKVNSQRRIMPGQRIGLPAQLPALRQPTSAALVAQAQSRFEQGDLEGARDMYDVIVRLEPQSSLAWAYRGLIQWRLGQYQAAQRDAQKALQLNPQLALAHVVQALALQAQGKPQQAEKALSRASQLQAPQELIALLGAQCTLKAQQPKKTLEWLAGFRSVDPWAQMYRAQALWELNQDAEALRALEEALRAWPQWSQALALRARVYLRRGQPGPAIRDWTVVLEHQPQNHWARFHRAQALIRAGKWAQALEDLNRVVEAQGPSPAALRMRAQVYFQLGKLSEALADVDQVVSQKPQGKDHLLRAQVLLGLRHYEEALEELQKAEAKNLRTAELYMLRAQTLEQLGQHEAALADYAEAFRLQPALVQAAMNQVRLLLRLHRLQEAQSVCRQVLQLDPQHRQARIYLAESLLESGQVEEATRLLQELIAVPGPEEQMAHLHRLLGKAYAAQKNWAQAQEHFRRALQLRPTDAKAYLDRALALLGAGKVEAALDDLQSACRLAPEDPQCRLARAMALEAKGLYRQALQDLNWLLRHHKWAKGYVLRARIYVAQEAYALALEDLNEALKQDPQHWAAYRLRAALHLQLDQPEQALADARKVPARNQDPQLLTIEGESLRRLGKVQEALAVLNSALEQESQLVAALISRGMAHLHLGNPQKALADLDKALQLQPNNARAYLQRGVILAHMGRYEDAARDFEQAIELNPNEPKAHAYRAMTALKQGKYREAVRYYTEALRLHPRYALAYYERGRAYWELGQQQQALQDYRRAVELNPIYAGAFYDEP